MDPLNLSDGIFREFVHRRDRDSRHEEEQINAQHRRECIRLGSLVTGAVGISLMVFLRGVAHEEAVYLVGLIPLLIGVALFVSAQFLAPKL